MPLNVSKVTTSEKLLDKMLYCGPCLGIKGHVIRETPPLVGM